MEEAPPPYTPAQNGAYGERSARNQQTTPSQPMYVQGPGETGFRAGPVPLGFRVPSPPSKPMYAQGPGEVQFQHASAPPKQLYVQGPGDVQFQRTSSPSTNNRPGQPATNMTTVLTFPTSFGIYHASGSSTNMVIALSADSQPIFYVSTHNGFSSQPSVVLHKGAYESAAPMATASFGSFSSNTDIMLMNQPLRLQSEGAFTSVRFFLFPMPQANGQTRMERFEWKSSSGPEVQRLNGSRHGMKCVRAKTGEVIAAWARPNEGHKKKGKMSFLMRERGLTDNRLEMMVVVTILAIMEKLRRQSNNRRGAGGAFGAGGFAAAGGGGGGGGGC